ncbi:hypothetical protein JQC92_02315 [Shewanella sp. 202IG2-18]|uniref:phage adaptor protein n=1 Tax=Parashewanella hymeniacidonis TaxID=2807618 RepID=UPI001960DAE5|nr:DUF6682 family protein [Parashewanella hymeniacidonis]MBM7070875.1 hypothetical protein [Parashewanella hymeniacidonis]
MAIITAQEIVARVNKLLNDNGYVRWPKEELLNYLNDAQKAIVLRRPDAHTVDIDDFECVQGTKQRLPADALRLIDITRNSSGRAIKGPFDRTVLDDNYPDWYADAPQAYAEHYIYDQRNPKTFYLHPAVAANTEITLVYSKSPDVISVNQLDSGEVIGLDDIYLNAIIEWVMYRAYMKDAEYAANSNKSLMHLNAFKSQMGEKTQADGSMAGQEIKE